MYLGWCFAITSITSILGAGVILLVAAVLAILLVDHGPSLGVFGDLPSCAVAEKNVTRLGRPPHTPNFDKFRLRLVHELHQHLAGASYAGRRVHDYPHGRPHARVFTVTDELYG